MLSIILKILSILGILLLCLLGLVVLMVILVLFFPIGYQLTGEKNAEHMSVSARAIWLFGLLRVRFDYPEPGGIIVKVLPFTVFDSGKQSGGKTKKDSDGSEEKTKKGSRAGKKSKKENKEEKDSKADPGQDSSVGESQDMALSADQEQDTASEINPEASEDSPVKTDYEKQDTTEQDNAEPAILKKFNKIKYTIRSIYDKIKNIWENISYYIELLQEEETKLLFSHVIYRLGKILKSIRPRRVRGQILFGTGSPDTTGYAYGVYGMLSPFLGSKLLVTPDFTRAILEGDIYISGHITAYTILWNGLKVLLDKKLRRFIKKMKAGRKK